MDTAFPDETLKLDSTAVREGVAWWRADWVRSVLRDAQSETQGTTLAGLLDDLSAGTMSDEWFRRHLGLIIRQALKSDPDLLPITLLASIARYRQVVMELAPLQRDVLFITTQILGVAEPATVEGNIMGYWDVQIGDTPIT